MVSPLTLASTRQQLLNRAARDFMVFLPTGGGQHAAVRIVVAGLGPGAEHFSATSSVAVQSASLAWLSRASFQF